MKNNRKWSTFLLLAVFFIGLSVLLYPSLSNYWNSKTQSEAIADYEAMLKGVPKEDYSQYFLLAKEYNQKLYKLDLPLIEYEEAEGYSELLDLTGTGIMGYVSISKIGVELPVFHGTGEEVLSVAIGHLQGSSLPVGGESTHAVMSAHRGLPSARLFTDLDQLEVGDTFTITVFEVVLTYEVDQIRIVPPSDITLLGIVEGEDYCTLLTCTPYGINTDRLLVRGKRIDTVVRKTLYIETDGYLIDTLIVTPIVALPILTVLMLIVLFKPVKKISDEDDE